MVSVKMMMFLVFCFVLGNYISLMVEGQWFGAEWQEALTQLTGVRIHSLGLEQIPSITLGFFSHGLWKLLLWDYSFWSGGLIIFQILLVVVLSGGIIWGVGQWLIPIIAQAVGGVLGGLRRMVGLG